MTQPTCAFQDCGKTVHSRGYCNGHYQQWRAGKELRPLGKYSRSPIDGMCTVEGCTNPHKSRGYCAKHRARMDRGTEIGGPELKNAPYGSLDELFQRNGWTEVIVRPELGACWEWNGGRNATGYGRTSFALKGKYNYLVHRLSYEHWVGDLLDSEVVCHKCDNPPCMNPAHLFKGSHADNQHDAVAKQRNAFGERNGHHKLTEDQVRSIRAAYVPRKVTQAYLGEVYGVSQTAIGLIVRGKRWSNQA